MRNYFLDIAEEKNKKHADIPSVIVFGEAYPSEIVFDFTVSIPDFPADAIQIPIDAGINLPPPTIQQPPLVMPGFSTDGLKKR